MWGRKQSSIGLQLTTGRIHVMFVLVVCVRKKWEAPTFRFILTHCAYSNIKQLGFWSET